MDERLKEIAVHYGMPHQLGKCCEELAELIVALQKYVDGRATIYDVATEIADVQITTEQMEFFFGISKIVAEEREKKLNRQINRMGEEKGNENVEKCAE